MKILFFKALGGLAKIILPRYSQRDINKLSKVDKALVGFRYWVTKNSLS